MFYRGFIFIFILLILPLLAFSANLQMEWGEFSLSVQSWENISLQNSYVSPIIITTPEYTSTTQDRGIGVWLDNVTENSFQILASNHQFDSTDTITINYFVIEEGNWTFPGTSSLIEAGKFSTNRVGSAGTGNWICPVNGNRVFFTENFSSNPIVFSTRASNNNNAWGITFQNSLLDEIQSPGINGACVGISQGNAPAPNPIVEYETVFWIAMDEFSGTVDGVEFESLWNAADTGTSGGNWINGFNDPSFPFEQNWDHTWLNPPVGAIVSQTSNNGGEGGFGVLHSVTNSQLRLFIDENIDRSHTRSESGGGFAFSGDLAFGNLPPNSSNLTISPTFTFENDIVSIGTQVSDPQSVFTINNVTAEILYPNSSLKNISLQNSVPSNLQLTTSDLEPGTKNFSVPPDESIWLDDWEYRKGFTINGSNVSSVSNYTMRLNVYNKEGTDFGQNVYLNGRANTDYSDIRFTNYLANESGILPHWKEREGPDYAIFWIKIDNISQAPNLTNFYIYYDNSNASSASDGKNTFLYFEDFENYTSTADDIRPPTWDDYNSGTVLLDTEAGGNRVLKKTLNNDPNGGRTSLGLNFSNYELIWKTNRINALAGQINRYGVSDENANGYSTFSSSFGSNMAYKLERRQNGGARQFSPNFQRNFATSFNTWYILRLSRYEGNFKHFFMDLSETVFETYENFDGTYSNFNTLYIHGGQEYWSDDFLLRNYIEPEPYFATWGNEEKWKNAIEGETLYTSYSNVDNSQIQDLTEIRVEIEVSNSSALASIQNANLAPSIEMSLSNAENADWQIIGSVFPTGAGTYSFTTSNNNILDNWKFKDNRNIRFRGLNLDNFNTSLVDFIEWDEVRVEIDYQEKNPSWFLEFNETQDSGIYNVTKIIVCDKGNLCSTNIYTNASFEITDKGNVSLISPQDNQKFIGQNQEINFTWNVRSSFVNNTCNLYIDGSLEYNILCPSGENISYLKNFSGRSITTWNVESIDGFGNLSFSDDYDFYIIDNVSLQVSKEITYVGLNQYFQNISLDKHSNDSFSLKYLDYTPSNFIPGSFSRLYDLFQIISVGTKNLLYWENTTSENISYSYTSNIKNYNSLDFFILGGE